MGEESQTSASYIFAVPYDMREESAQTVIYQASTKMAAEAICRLFSMTQNAHYSFCVKLVNDLPLDQRILCNEALQLLEVYSDPDPGVYDPEPPKALHEMAQFAVQAKAWEMELDNLVESSKKADQGPAKWEGMSPEERSNSGLVLLWMLAQTYYHILEQVISANLVNHLDLEVNQSYFWVINTITNLLKNHPDLRDFPDEFTPEFKDLYPLTILDSEWLDDVGLRAGAFLSTVQRYTIEKGMHEPANGSVGCALVEFFQSSIDRAVKSAESYRSKAKEHEKQLFGTAKVSDSKSAPPDNCSNVRSKRFRVALSFAGERRCFVREVAEHLAQVFGEKRILYDKYHEAELACVNLDILLQDLYLRESELIVVFICSRYTEKEWCGLEWRALRDLIKQKAAHMIMPFRFDSTKVPGLFSTDGYIEVEHKTPKEVADLILQRLDLNSQQSKAS